MEMKRPIQPLPCFASSPPVHLRRAHQPIDSLSPRRPSCPPRRNFYTLRHLSPRASAEPLNRAGRPAKREKPAPTSPASLHGLLLERKAVDGETRRGRTLRTRRWATLGEVGVEDVGSDDTRVEVAVAVQRVRRDYRVVGAVRVPVQRRCDRCAERFEELSRGKFEVWLATNEDGKLGDMEDVVGDVGPEAVEVFAAGVNGVDLTEHVKDAVWLGLPTKSLCGEDCQGVQMMDGSSGSVTYVGGQGSVMEVREEEKEVRERKEVVEKPIGERRGAGDKLLELKKKLEMQGL